MRRRRLARADSLVGLGRPRHDRPPRRHRRDGDRLRRAGRPVRDQRPRRERGLGRRRHVPRSAAGPPTHGRGGRCLVATSIGGRARDARRAAAPTPACRGASGCGRRRSSPPGSWRPGRTGSTSAHALGVAAVDTDRLAHVAWLATRALPYAFSVAGQEPPAEPLRVELTLPSGAIWSQRARRRAGPDHADPRAITAGCSCTGSRLPIPIW